MRMTASLYLHIPFCSPNMWGGICNYCDFFSIPAREGKDSTLMDSFTDAVLDDAADQLALFDIKNVPTVYIGGGTPSMLGAGRIGRLLTGLDALLKSRNTSVEFTVEANPESADQAFLQTCIEGPVSRISLGIQSFHEPSRLAIRRAGGGALLDERLAIAAEYFPGSFSADIITGLPFQSMAVLENDIKRLLSFKPAHVSLYSLVLEPRTPLGKQVSQLGEAACSLPSGDDADSLWIAGRDLLEKNKLAQYEVSNFALPGKACTHNIRYWRMESWLGAGPAASGTLIDDSTGTGRRYTYEADIAAYLAAPRPRIYSAQTEDLSKADLIQESLLMGFRLREGPDPHHFRRRFNCCLGDCIPKTIARWRDRGFFEEAVPGSFAPSKEGLLFVNRFLSDAFGELSAG